MQMINSVNYTIFNSIKINVHANQVNMDVLIYFI